MAHRLPASATVAPLVALLLTACAVPTPSVRCRADRSLEVNIQSLGEYQTDLAEATLTQSASHNVIWRIVGDQLQVHSLVFRATQSATEPIEPAHGTFVVAAPSGPTFNLSLIESYDLALKAAHSSPVRHVAVSLGQCAG